MTEMMRGIEESRSQMMVTPSFLLRVGGLPIDVVDALRFSETTGWIESILSLENRLLCGKDRLADALYAVISSYEDEQVLRRKLLHLRRDVFNMRSLDNYEEIKGLADMLLSPARELLAEWADLWKQHQQVLAMGQKLFSQEVYHKRVLLKKTIAIEDFRQGVALSSPALDSAIDAYLLSDNVNLKRSMRTVERSLLEYLLRTACKTSPFSTFTSVCAGKFAPQAAGGDMSVRYQIADMTKRSFTRLNMAILSRLSWLIIASPELRPELPVSLTPGWQIQKGRIRYLRRMQSEDEKGEGAANPRDVVHESVFYLPVGSLLTAIIDLLGTGRRMQFQQLAAQLCSLPAYQDAQEEISTYVEHLLRLGLLVVPALWIDMHDKYPLARYREGLLALKLPAVHKVAAYLEDVEKLVETYATALAPQRRDVLIEVKRLLRACYAALGQESIQLPATIIYEDTTITPRKLTINEADWQQVLSDSAEFQQLVPIFDANLPKRLITQGYFQARYGIGGRCDDFLSFAYDFRQRFFVHYLKNPRVPISVSGATNTVGHVNFFQQADIERLNSSQEVLATYMQQVYASFPGENEELILGDDFFDALAPYIPKDSGPLSSQSYFAQYMQRSDEALLIINHIYSGFTLMFSRFAHFFDAEEEQSLVDDLRAHLERLQPEGAVFAELTGGYEATNLNLHPRVTAYELVCPGDLSSRPGEEQIPLEDLFLQDNGKADGLALYSKRLGKKVIPLYLGFLLPIALPEIQQVLFNFSYVTMYMADFWEHIQRADEGEDVHFYPRLRYKHLVLQRAHWELEADVFPQRTSGQPDADFFLAVTRWRKKHHIPARVFVTTKMSLEPSATSDAAIPQKKYTYKPLYVDFENYFSLALLEATLRGATARVVITEMLPQRDHLWFQKDGQSYVSEFVWEMNTRKGDYNG